MKHETKDRAEREQQTKKRPTGVIVGACICVGICLILVLVLVLAEPVGAWRLRADVLTAMESEGDLRVVLSDPLQGGDGLFSSAEVILAGEEAKTLKGLLAEILQNSGYEDTEAVRSGLWMIQAAVYADGSPVARLYLEEDEICLEKNGKKIVFEVSDGDEDSYEALYRGIRGQLADSAKETPKDAQ